MRYSILEFIVICRLRMLCPNSIFMYIRMESLKQLQSLTLERKRGSSGCYHNIGSKFISISYIYLDGWGWLWFFFPLDWFAAYIINTCCLLYICYELVYSFGLFLKPLALSLNMYLFVLSASLWTLLWGFWYWLLYCNENFYLSVWLSDLSGFLSIVFVCCTSLPKICHQTCLYTLSSSDMLTTKLGFKDA